MDLGVKARLDQILSAMSSSVQIGATVGRTGPAEPDRGMVLGVLGALCIGCFLIAYPSMRRQLTAASPART